MKRVKRENFRSRVPEGALFIGRPSRYGNPFKVSEYGRAEALSKYSDFLSALIADKPDFLKPLVGSDVACYCNLEDECHGDIIIRFIQEGLGIS